MTREEAIFCEKSYIGETNCKDCRYYGTETCLSRESHKMAIKVLEQTKWIPVSERLPNHVEYIKNNGLFNVSDGNRSYSEWFDIYDKKMFGDPTISGGFRVDYAVTAWMPLPELYKAESEE